jgi:hypothetical protein
MRSATRHECVNRSQVFVLWKCTGRFRCHGSIVGKRERRGEVRAKIQNEAHRHGSVVHQKSKYILFHTISYRTIPLVLPYSILSNNICLISFYNIPSHLSDMGVSVLGCGCGQLQTIDFSYCDRLTDTGVSALGRGCGQLQPINLSCCRLL